MKYSIITPVYNRADCVARCLDSVIRNLQWGVELEHIVVDDGSHDETPKIVQNYADKHPHIKFTHFHRIEVPMRPVMQLLQRLLVSIVSSWIVMTILWMRQSIL